VHCLSFFLGFCSEPKGIRCSLIANQGAFALVGISWGISGYCPGPAIALLAAPNWELAVFLPAMLLGYGLHWYLFERRAQKGDGVTPENEEAEQFTCS
jgi:uncharacterized membrane protein YedE/YeeE